MDSAAKYDSMRREHPQAKYHNHQGMQEEQHLWNVKHSDALRWPVLGHEMHGENLLNQSASSEKNFIEFFHGSSQKSVTFFKGIWDKSSFWRKITG